MADPPAHNRYVTGSSPVAWTIFIMKIELEYPYSTLYAKGYLVTSDTSENEIEETVTTIIKRMATEWMAQQLQRKKDINISTFFSNCCERALKEIESKLKASRENLKYLNKRINRISAACEKNIVAELISENIQTLKQEIVQLEEAKYVHSLVSRMSTKYTSEEEIEEVQKEDAIKQYSTKDAYLMEQLREAMRQFHYPGA